MGGSGASSKGRATAGASPRRSLPGDLGDARHGWKKETRTTYDGDIVIKYESATSPSDEMYGVYIVNKHGRTSPWVLVFNNRSAAVLPRSIDLTDSQARALLKLPVKKFRYADQHAIANFVDRNDLPGLRKYLKGR
jgi:hypothetical protein